MFKLSTTTYKRHRAFSLVELLVVVAVVGILLSLTMAGFANFGQARGLKMAAEIVSAYANMARERAVSRNSVVALAVRGANGSDDSAYRKVALFELVRNPDGSAPSPNNWQMLRPWKVLPEGTAMRPPVDGSLSVIDGANPTFSPEIPTLLLSNAGGPVRFVYFLPNGGLVGSEAMGVRLARGIVEGGEFRATGTDNFVDLLLLPFNGRLVFSQAQ